MATRYHVNPETGRPNICRAEIKCKFQEEGAPPIPHFDTKAEAQAYQNAKDQEVYGEFATITTKPEVRDAPVPIAGRPGLVYLDGEVMTAYDANLRHTLREHARKRLEENAKANHHVYEEAMSQTVAEKKMQESINFASERGNTILMRKLSNARMMPSGVVHSDDGKYDANEVVKLDVEEKHLKEQRKRVEDTIKDYVATERPAPGSYTAEIDGTKATVTISKVLSETVEKDLKSKNPALWNKISKDGNPKYTKASLKAAGFKEEEFEALKEKTSKYDLVVNKVPDTGQEQIVARTDLGDGDEQAKLQQGAKNLAEVVNTSRVVTKKTAAERKKQAESAKNIAKNAAGAADLDGKESAFFAARRYGNGGLVSWNNTPKYSAAAVEKAFAKDPRLKKAQIIERKIDPKLAKEHLTEQQYNQLFSATKVGFRVSEPKP